MKIAFDKESFSKSLKQKRIIDENIDLRELAKKLKISISTLSRCENGETPNVVTYATLCNWLETPMDYFITTK